MASNPYVNKVIYGTTVLVDLTDTTAEAADVAAGKVFYGADGSRIVGTASGGGTMDTLWYNTSPTSSFSAKQVAIGNHGTHADAYDFLLIDYIFSTSAQDHSTLLVAVSDLAVVGREYSLRINAASYNRTGARNFYFNYSGSTIDYGHLYFAGASYNASSNNGYVIPYKIYGIKL